MGFYDAFFGSDQSLYTAYAIIAAIIAICITILFTSTDIPISSRLIMVLFVIITLIPSIFLTLFEITCIVTGGTEPNNWWCYTFAWILAAFIIIYCIFIVIISIMSLVTYNNAIDNINNEEEKNKLNPQEANNIAKHIMETQKPVENPYTYQPSHMNNNQIASTDKPKETFYNQDNNPLNSLTSLTDSLNQLGNANSFISSAAKEIINNMANDNKNKAQFGNMIAHFDNVESSNNNYSAPPSSAPSASGDKAKFSNIAPFTDAKKSLFTNYDDTLPGSADDSLGGYPDVFENK